VPDKQMMHVKSAHIDSELEIIEYIEFGDRDVVVYCDGSADKEGHAGWSACYFGKNGRTRSTFEWQARTDISSQAAELRAAIRALQFLTREGVSVRIVTDSAYVVRCFVEGWIPRWRNKGWLHKGKERPNRALWETLEGFVELHDVEFEHVNGHVGEPGNEHAHMLANYARERCKRERLERGSRDSAAQYRASGARDTYRPSKRGRSGRARSRSVDMEKRG
jgi:ribonuclease HI